MAFSVQLAAEDTSAPAPRTVLHAAIASAPTDQQQRRHLTNHGRSSFNRRNDHGRNQVALSTAFAAELTSSAAPRTVLHAATARLPPISTSGHYLAKHGTISCLMAERTLQIRDSVP